MRTLIVSALVAIVAAFVLSPIGSAFLPPEPEWKQHMWSHGSAALPFVISAIIGWRKRPTQRNLPAFLLLLGVTGVAIGQTLEAAAARIEYPGMGIIHGGSGVLTMLAVLLVVSGLLSVLVRSLLRDRLASIPLWASIAGGIVGSAILIVIAKIVIGF